MTLLINNTIKILNKRTKSGGLNTTINGLIFEYKTSIENKLIEHGFNKNIMNKKSKYGYYYEHINNKNKKIIYMTQSGFKKYFKEKFDISTYKQPDEAFIFISNNIYDVKILEKKNQNSEGSVEDKLKTGTFNRREYEKMLNIKDEYKFNVAYAFCVNRFLEEKFKSKNVKYKNILEIMKEDGINLFYGDDENYFNDLYEWINKPIMI
jgi:hypothetical protein